MIALAGACPAIDERDAAVLHWDARAILAARSTATISAEVGYRVVKIHRQAGESFRVGDTLVEFDTRYPLIRLESAKSALAAAEAALTAAERLHERNSASLVEIEAARRDRAQAWARCEELRLELEACTVRAPFDGRVVEVMVNEHELVARGTGLIAIEDDSRFLAHFIFPESQWGRASIGDAMAVDIPLVGVRTTARVSRIASGIDPASRTFDLWADIDNSGGRLRSGMTAALSEEAEER